MPWYVYILENQQGLNYVGVTGQSPEARLAQHNAGLNKWTRARKPWRLVYSEAFEDKTVAIKRERFFKTGAGRRLRKDLLQ